ncbi:MAG: YciI family protein [Allorhizobium sp.]
MFFLMRCLHHQDMDAAREVHRPAHRAWVQSGGEGRALVLIGSALLGADGAPIGNFGILQADSPEKARAFAEGDPFNRAGIVATIELTPLPDTFQAHRIGEPMTARR